MAQQQVPAARLQKAEVCNADGNEAFLDGCYEDARNFYGAAISYSARTVAKYFGNRAQVHLRTGAFEPARADAAEAARLEPASVKFAFRLAKALVALDDHAAARSELDRIVAVDPAAAANGDIRGLVAEVDAKLGKRAPPKAPQAGRDDSGAGPANGARASQVRRPLFASRPPQPLDPDQFWVGRPRALAYGFIVNAYRIRTYNGFARPPDWSMGIRDGRQIDPRAVERDFLRFFRTVRRNLATPLPAWWSDETVLAVARMDRLPDPLERIAHPDRMRRSSLACTPIDPATYSDLCTGDPPRCPVEEVRHIITVRGDAELDPVPAWMYTRENGATSAEDARIFMMHSLVAGDDDDDDDTVDVPCDESDEEDEQDEETFEEEEEEEEWYDTDEEDDEADEEADEEVVSESATNDDSDDGGLPPLEDIVPGAAAHPGDSDSDGGDAGSSGGEDGPPPLEDIVPGREGPPLPEGGAAPAAARDNIGARRGTIPDDGVTDAGVDSGEAPPLEDNGTTGAAAAGTRHGSDAGSASSDGGASLPPLEDVAGGAANAGAASGDGDEGDDDDLPPLEDIAPSAAGDGSPAESAVSEARGHDDGDRASPADGDDEGPPPLEDIGSDDSGAPPPLEDIA